MLIVKRSPISGKIHAQKIDVTLEQLFDWREKELIQEAMPELSPDEREFILTGIPDHEWKQIWATDDEGEDYSEYGVYEEEE